MRIRPNSRALVEQVVAYLDLTAEMRRLTALCEARGVAYDPDTIAAEAMARLAADRGLDTPYSVAFQLALAPAGRGAPPSAAAE
ncbi:MAG TPA: hypothetical protein VFL91_17940 [Thermomicrobiales bacterium]|nr:hypothetical protein [Thermomicrobiales bacterium]